MLIGGSMGLCRSSGDFANLIMQRWFSILFIGHRLEIRRTKVGDNRIMLCVVTQSERADDRLGC